MACTSPIAEIVAVVLFAIDLVAIRPVAIRLGRRLFRQLDVLGPYRHQNSIVRAQILAASDIELADRGADPAALATTRSDHRGVEKVRGTDEIGDEPVARPLVDVARRADLHDAPAVHHGDHVRQGERLGLVVGHVNGGDAELALNALQLEAHALAQLGIEVRQRLVEEKKPRLHHQRAGQRKTLLLAARQLGRGAVDEIVERHRA